MTNMFYEFHSSKMQYDTDVASKYIFITLDVPEDYYVYTTLNENETAKLEEN